ncbi:MAG: hypothetical protein EP315_09360 [Gammaproteobacteria bacterium]|nr:MAG: hypothetical protein EP315_09360 [Gammaproteobacteria bacterium]
MSHDNISQALEAICHLGCKEVNDIIESMKNGVCPQQASHLSALEKDLLLEELKNIMAVYERKKR